MVLWSCQMKPLVYIVTSGGMMEVCSLVASLQEVRECNLGLEHTVANTYLELIWFCTYIMHYQSTNRLQTNYPQHPRL